jgi:hypothetical protein
MQQKANTKEMAQIRAKARAHVSRRTTTILQAPDQYQDN